MTNIDAIKEMLKGKKMTHKQYNECWVYFDGEEFRLANRTGYDERLNLLLPECGWEEYKVVNFTEAFEAYESGAVIQSLVEGGKWRKMSETFTKHGDWKCWSRNQIRDKWRIVE